jgi:hypothetical protein
LEQGGWGRWEGNKFSSKQLENSELKMVMIMMIVGGRGVPRRMSAGFPPRMRENERKKNLLKGRRDRRGSTSKGRDEPWRTNALGTSS